MDEETVVVEEESNSDYTMRNRRICQVLSVVAMAIAFAAILTWTFKVEMSAIIIVSEKYYSIFDIAASSSQYGGLIYFLVGMTLGTAALGVLSPRWGLVSGVVIILIASLMSNSKGGSAYFNIVHYNLDTGPILGQGLMYGLPVILFFLVACLFMRSSYVGTPASGYKKRFFGMLYNVDPRWDEPGEKVVPMQSEDAGSGGSEYN